MDFTLQTHTNVIHGFQVGIEALQGVKSVVKSVVKCVQGDECQGDDHTCLEGKVCIVVVSHTQARLAQLLLHVLGQVKQTPKHLCIGECFCHSEKNPLCFLSVTKDTNQLSSISICTCICKLITCSYCQHVCVLLLLHVMLQSNTLHLPSWDNNFTVSLGDWALSLFEIESWSDCDERCFVAHWYLIGLCSVSLLIVIGSGGSDLEEYSLGRIWVY